MPVYWTRVGHGGIHLAFAFPVCPTNVQQGVAHGTQGEGQGTGLARGAGKIKTSRQALLAHNRARLASRLPQLKGKAGTWCARHYIGEQQYELEALGIADDLSDADGVAILSYWQAQDKARERMVKRAHAAAGKTGPLTVADAMDVYLEYLESKNPRTAVDARSRDRLFIRPKLGHFEIDSLTAEQLQRWHASLAKAPRHARSWNGVKRKSRSGTAMMDSEQDAQAPTAR